MAHGSPAHKRPSSTRKSLRWRVPLAYLLPAALCMLAIPLAVLAAGTAQAASVPCASASEIDAMLDVGPYVPGEAIVVVDATKALHTEAIANATELMQADAQSYAEATGEEARSGAGVVIEHVVREGADTAELLAELASDPRVLSVEPNYVYEVPDEQAEDDQDTGLLSAEGSASGYDFDRSLDLSGWQWASSGQTVMTMPDTRAEKSVGVHAPAWNDSSYASASTDCIVAVLDTGVDYEHPDLRDYIYRFSPELQETLGCGEYGAAFKGVDPTDPMDDHGHGTHCAGNVVAAWNGVGTSGVATGVKVMALKVSD